MSVAKSDGFELIERIEYPIEVEGFHYFEILDYGGEFENRYTFNVSSIDGCVDSDPEVNRTIETAHYINANQSEKSICSGDPDWYEFDVFANESLEIVVAPTSGSLADMTAELWKDGVMLDPPVREGSLLRFAETFTAAGLAELKVETTSAAEYDIVIFLVN